MKYRYLCSRFILLLPLISTMACAAEQTWHRQPFRLEAGGKMIDTNPADPGGHAGPYLADLDDDGRRDLVVGSISGRFQLFRNIGLDSEPKFSANPTWLMSGEAPAAVPNFCCVASGPQIVDVDGDHILDLTSGSYAPGAIYWFKGLGDGRYATRLMFTDFLGLPVFAHPEKVYEYDSRSDSYAANIAWIDWDNDGLQDLVIGDSSGELFVRLQKEADDNDPTPPPIKGQPMFWPKDWQTRSGRINEVLVNGEKTIPDFHSAPAVADWDGDGLFDILVGSYSGAVYLLRNSGKIGEPKFNNCEQLIGPGVAMQWLEPGEVPKRGRRSQVHVADFNNDGKPDLLVGDWFMLTQPRTDLTAKERKEMQVIHAQLVALDEQTGYDFSIARYKAKAYSGNDRREDMKKAQGLEKRLQPYVKSYRFGSSRVSTQSYHGTVWVFPSK